MRPSLAVAALLLVACSRPGGGAPADPPRTPAPGPTQPPATTTPATRRGTPDTSPGPGAAFGALEAHRSYRFTVVVRNDGFPGTGLAVGEATLDGTVMRHPLDEIALHYRLVDRAGILDLDFTSVEGEGTLRYGDIATGVPADGAAQPFGRWLPAAVGRHLDPVLGQLRLAGALERDGRILDHWSADALAVDDDLDDLFGVDAAWDLDVWTDRRGGWLTACSISGTTGEGEGARHLAADIRVEGVDDRDNRVVPILPDRPSPEPTPSPHDGLEVPLGVDATWP